MDMRPATLALEAVEAKDIQRGNIVLCDDNISRGVVLVNKQIGFCYITLENDTVLFVRDTDLIKRIRR